MKFSHSLQFNSVPDWSSHYISYSNLKKLTYQLEKRKHQANTPQTDGLPDAEQSPLLSQDIGWDDPDAIFSRKLEEELEKICSFYQLKELEIYGEVNALRKDVDDFEAEHTAGEQDGEDGQRRQNAWARARQQSIFRSFQTGSRHRASTMSSHEAPPEDPDEDSENDETNEHTALAKNKSIDAGRAARGTADIVTGELPSPVDRRGSAELRLRRPSTAFNDFGDDALEALYEEGITLKKRTVNLYVNVCELRSFIQLNQTGFRKILKKYDKTLDRDLKDRWMASNVAVSYPFRQSTTTSLNDALYGLEKGYATVVTKGDVEAARKELRLHLREHVVWERNTVWREMIGIERKAQAANLGIRHTMLGQDTDPQNARLQGDAEATKMKQVRTPIGRYSCPKFLFDPTFWTLILVIAVFAVLLAVPIMKETEQQNCLALVIFVSLLWATEVSLPFHLNWPSVC